MNEKRSAGLHTIRGGAVGTAINCSQHPGTQTMKLWPLDATAIAHWGSAGLAENYSRLCSTALIGYFDLPLNRKLALPFTQLAFSQK